MTADERWMHTHPALRVNRLTDLAARMEARCEVLKARRSPHLACVVNRYATIECAADRVAMGMVGPYRDAA
jgi:hypothetical protein